MADVEPRNSALEQLLRMFTYKGKTILPEGSGISRNLKIHVDPGDTIDHRIREQIQSIPNVGKEPRKTMQLGPEASTLGFGTSADYTNASRIMDSLRQHGNSIVESIPWPTLPSAKKDPERIEATKVQADPASFVGIINAGGIIPKSLPVALKELEGIRKFGEPIHPLPIPATRTSLEGTAIQRWMNPNNIVSTNPKDLPELMAKDVMWEKPMQTFIPEEVTPQPMRVYTIGKRGNKSLAADSPHFSHGHARQVPFKNVNLWEELQSDLQGAPSSVDEDFIKRILTDITQQTDKEGKIFAIPSSVGSTMRGGANVESIYENIPKQVGMVPDTLRFKVPDFSWDVHSRDPQSLEMGIRKLRESLLEGESAAYRQGPLLKNSERIMKGGGNVTEGRGEYILDVPIHTRPQDIALAKKLGIYESPARNSEYQDLLRHNEWSDKMEPQHAQQFFDALLKDPLDPRLKMSRDNYSKLVLSRGRVYDTAKMAQRDPNFEKLLANMWVNDKYGGYYTPSEWKTAFPELLSEATDDIDFFTRRSPLHLIDLMQKYNIKP